MTATRSDIIVQNNIYWDMLYIGGGGGGEQG